MDKEINRQAFQTDQKLDWAICGPETGAGARPVHPEWVRSLRDQCKAAGVPFFYKGGLLDGVEYNEFPGMKR